jgi:RNA polymerase sigma factor (sigma-70 family)
VSADRAASGGKSANRGFPTTRWSVISSVRSQDTEWQGALAALCQTYWSPIYSYARYRGYPADEAEDLTQGFFAKLLEKNYVAQADRDRGRFRTFLLSSFNHFVANQWDYAHAAKRGGHNTILSLNFETAEGALNVEPVESVTPEILFARQWARSLLNRVLGRLRDSQPPDAGQRFERLKHCLSDTVPRTPYRELAAELDMSEGAVKVAVHRLRKDFSRLLWEEVADTVDDEDAVADEIRFLLESQG